MILSVTGHRPDKLGGYTLEAALVLSGFAGQELRRFDPLPERVLTGLALGWDMAVAYACGHLKIPYEACVPFLGQELRWTQYWQKNYRNFLAGACKVTVVTEGGYASYKMWKRNIYMVDGSDQLLALFNGSVGGTKHCVEYAAEVNKPTDNCWKRWVQYQEDRKTFHWKES